MAGLMNVPGLRGILQARALNEESANNDLRQQMGQLQQVGVLQGILAKRQAMQQEQEIRGVLSNVAQASGGDPEKMHQLLLQTGNPMAIKLAQGLEGHLDRKAKLESDNLNRDAMRQQRLDELTQRGEQEIARVREQAAQNRITREEADRREAAMREQMTRLAASLRPAPQPRNLQLTTDEQGNQLIVNPDGTTRPLTRDDGTGVRKPIAADKPMTEFQGKASLYGTRGAQSDKVLRALEDKISTTGLAAGQATGVVGNALMSSEQRRVDQAQRDFVNAVLRQESGAVISDAEFANAKRQYFPAPGDDPKVIAQKRANRQLAIQGFARMAGPKGAADIEAIIKEPLLPGVAATNPTPQQASGNVGGSTYVETRRTADGRMLGKKADGTVEEIK